jgi:hypothetical protein
MRSNLPNLPGLGTARFVFGVFGFAFLGVGLTVLGFLWLTPFDTFGSPPLIFRIFGSFIAISFVAVGGSAAWSAISGKLTSRMPAIAGQLRAVHAVPGSYTCPHCAAPLQARADVSPSGDVKCTFCNAWFNVHQQRA